MENELIIKSLRVKFAVPIPLCHSVPIPENRNIDIEVILRVQEISLPLQSKSSQVLELSRSFIRRALARL